MELPSSELELNCLKDFVPDSELELELILPELELELNCKDGIDPDYVLYQNIKFEACFMSTITNDS